MRMRRTILLMLVISMLVALLTSCDMETQTPSEVSEKIDTERAAAILNLTEDEMKLGAFTADNSPDLSELALTEYDYSELKEFFEENPDADTSITGVNERFPIECLRCREVALESAKSVYRFYTVYKVADGGYYYVFWEVNGDSVVSNDTKKADYNGYISSLSSDEDFPVAVTITGTTDEICSQIREIDPAAEFELKLDHFNDLAVYRLLEGGKIQELTYSSTNFESNMRYCTSRFLSSRYEIDCCLAYIFTSDLPMGEEDVGKENLSEKEPSMPDTAEMGLKKGDMQFERFTADNTTPLSEYELLEYELSDLYDFFGRYDSDLTLVLEGKGYSGRYDLYPSKVNTWFPLQCIRCVKVENSDNTYILRYYTVYKVKEGGYFYVFWSNLNDEFQVSHFGYIPHLNSRKDFDSIIVGESNLADVYFIDPALDFRFNATSSGGYSLSLLDSGEILRIDYKYDRLEDLCSLVVTGVTVLQKDEVSCSLTQIFKADLLRD